MPIPLLALLVTAAGPGLTPTDLRTEYLVDPLGIEERHPRLSWVDTSSSRGATQRAYRIIVSNSQKLLNRDKGDMWDSGVVNSGESNQIAYGGKPLQSRQHAYWKVIAWDQSGGKSESGTGQWEMGLLNKSDWQAKWIGMPKKRADESSGWDGVSWLWYHEGDVHTSMPTGSVVYLHKTLPLTGKSQIDSATLGIAADDHFALAVNGKPVGKGDGWRSVTAINIKPFLHAGDNDIVVEGINESGPAGIAVSGAMRFTDGSTQRIRTDGTWQSAKHLTDSWEPATVLGRVGMAPWGQPSIPMLNGPAPYARVTFDSDKSIAKARLYVSALGLYKAYIDGHPIGHDIFRPGWTDYNKRVQYQTYDVTRQVTGGLQTLGLVLGNGWYCGKVGGTPGHNYGTEPMGLAQLEITYKNGQRFTVATGSRWLIGTGPIVKDDLLDGETYDARKEYEGWGAPTFHPNDWTSPLVQPLSKIALDAQQDPSVQELQELKPRTIKEHPKGSFVFDLGQNMVGWARLKVRGPSGTTVRLRFAEMLNPDGTIYTTNLRGAKATDYYTLAGHGEETYEPTFTFHGFRYVEVTGYPGIPTKDAITGIVVGTNNTRVGDFSCSDPLVNQLASNIFWGARGNYLEVPTDCPQRDERLGWMGDAQIFVRTATFDNDIAAFMTKWTRDVEDAQSARGGYSDVTPRVGDQSDGAPAWGDAGVIVPWTIYEAYGDTRLIARHYPSMERWLSYIDNANPDHIWRKNSNNNFGDWLNVQDPTPPEVLATMFFAHDADLMARMAHVLGYKDKEKHYTELFSQIKQAFNEQYVAVDGVVAGNSQTAYIISMWFNLLPQDKREMAIQHLASLIVDKKHNHLSTGFLGVGYLCPTLTSMGRSDIAYKLLENDTYPSWGYSIRQGATTIWERWDGWRADKGFQDPGMNSFNHYSMGSVGEWMMAKVAGIDWDVNEPGYRHIIVNPVIGGGMTYAKASLNSIRGQIRTEWRRQPNGAFTLDVTVPANTHATVTIPSLSPSKIRESGRLADSAPGVRTLSTSKTEAAFEVGGGTYHFTTYL